MSWQGGRSDVIVGDATAHDREELAVKTLRRGNYLLEITRGDARGSPVRGTLDVTVLGVKKSLPFELTGTHAVVGHVNVSLTSQLESLDGAGGVTPRRPAYSQLASNWQNSSPRVRHFVSSTIGRLPPDSSSERSTKPATERQCTACGVGNPRSRSTAARRAARRDLEVARVVVRAPQPHRAAEDPLRRCRP